MSSSSTSASEATGRAGAPRRIVLRYLAMVVLVVVLSVPAFIGLVALGSGLVLNMAYDKVAVRLIDKMALAAERPGRRILAFAGSNTFFDLRGSDLEAATGLPAINLGLHSGQGLAFVLWQAERTARPGDIVILPLEDAYYRLPGITEYGANVSLALGTAFFRSLPLAERIAYLEYFHIRRLLKFLAARLGIASFELESGWAYPITPHGDVDAPTPAAAALSDLIYHVSRQGPHGFTILPDAERRIAAFVRRMAEKNVTVLFTLPGIMENGAPTGPQVAKLRRALAGLGADLVDLPERGAIPAEMMLDTIYHAAAPGARLYTAQLISALCGREEELDIECDPGALAAAEALRAGAAERSYLFDADESLATIQPWGDGTAVTLEPGRPVSFKVAVLRGCRNRLKLGLTGAGRLDIRFAGKPVKPVEFRSGEEQAVRALPNTPGLVEVELKPAEGSNMELHNVLRMSACGR